MGQFVQHQADTGQELQWKSWRTFAEVVSYIWCRVVPNLTYSTLIARRIPGPNITESTKIG
jgi:hypothetical protein